MFFNKHFFSWKDIFLLYGWYAPSLALAVAFMQVEDETSMVSIVLEAIGYTFWPFLIGYVIVSLLLPSCTIGKRALFGGIFSMFVVAAAIFINQPGN